MGQYSPAAYDSILLQKVKLLLEGALNRAKSSGTIGKSSSFEQFVLDLDVSDKTSRRAFESLLHETTSRKPKKGGSAETAGTIYPRDQQGIPTVAPPLQVNRSTIDAALFSDSEGEESEIDELMDPPPIDEVLQGLPPGIQRFGNNNPSARIPHYGRPLPTEPSVVTPITAPRFGGAAAREAFVRETIIAGELSEEINGHRVNRVPRILQPPASAINLAEGRARERRRLELLELTSQRDELLLMGGSSPILSSESDHEEVTNEFLSFSELQRGLRRSTIAARNPITTTTTESSEPSRNPSRSLSPENSRATNSSSTSPEDSGEKDGMEVDGIENAVEETSASIAERFAARSRETLPRFGGRVPRSRATSTAERGALA